MVYCILVVMFLLNSLEILLICRLLLKNVTGCSYLVELSPNPSLLSKTQKFMLTGLFKSALGRPKTKYLHLSGTKDQGNLYAPLLLMTYLMVSNVSQEPSSHYTYQAAHFYGGLHKWFRQQLKPWRPLFLGSLKKRPANVHPLSLHHLLILGEPRTLVSKQPAYVSLPYGLCVVLPFQ